MKAPLDDSSETLVVRRLRRVMALFTGLLVASTWPLWTPRTPFPDIPWFAWAVDWPPEEWDWLWLASLFGFIISQFVPRRFEGRRLTILRCLLFAGAVMLLPTDQHRLQPWVWQMLIGSVMIGLSPQDRLTLKLLRVFTVSVYVWSAVSKFDWAFVEGHGQVLLEGLSQSLGVSTDLWSDAARLAMAISFPAVELLVVVLLAIPGLRRLGLATSIVMHGGLLLALGPLGLNHEWGVSIWNLYFIVQNVLIFGRRLEPDEEWDRKEEWSVRTIATRTAIIVVAVMPGLSIAGLWDWWPSWAVYSSRPAVVQIFVDVDDVERLPPSLQSHVGPPEPLSEWCSVNLDAWSYETCWCPMYPQKRYRLAVIRAVSVRSDVQVRVDVRSSPNRRTGERKERTYLRNELKLRVGFDKFWLNMQPREELPGQ